MSENLSSAASAGSTFIPSQPVEFPSLSSNSSDASLSGQFRPKAFIRRKILASQPLPPNALTEEQVNIRLAEQREAFHREQQARREQEELFAKLQAEDEERERLAQVSPSKKALLLRKVPRENTSPTRLTQPLSLALPTVLGVGPGSPNWRAPQGNINNFDVVGSPSRFRDVRDTELQDQDEEQELSEEVENLSFNPSASAAAASSSSPPANNESSEFELLSESQKLAQRITSGLGASSFVAGGRKNKSQIAPPKHSGAHLGKTWQHSQFLADKKQRQSKAMSSLVKNNVRAEEEKLVRQGLPSWASRTVDDLVVRGDDLFEIADVDEAKWFAQRAQALTARDRAVDEDSTRSNGYYQRSEEDIKAREVAKEAKKARKRAAALAHAAFEATVQGPSLVLSEGRLFFPLKQGPITQVGEDSSSVSSAAKVPGANDRVSRSVTLRNNGSTSVTYEWRVIDGALTHAARDVRPAPAGSPMPTAAPLICSADPTGFFIASQARGVLLPGEVAEVVFTFIPGTKSGMFVQRIALETVPKLSRPLTERQSIDKQARQASGIDVSSDLDPAVVLTGHNIPLDTSSVARASLYQSLVNWKNKHVSALQLHKAVHSVKDPPPPLEYHRELFYTKNRDQKLFYYADLMPEWHQLARDVFDCHKRYLRENLVWDYSATSLYKWITSIPWRNHSKIGDLQDRYSELVSKCQVRPAPHPQRYEVAFGLLSNIASSIPRLSTRFATELHISEPLEQDLRKAQEEKQKKEEEERNAKLPFHLRTGAASSHAHNLSPEAKKIKEEEAAAKAAVKSAQDADDLAKRNEREALTNTYSEKLHAEVKAQLTEALSFFDFLAAPQNTNLDPQALHPERSIAEATTTAAAGTTSAEPALDVSVLQRTLAALMPKDTTAPVAASPATKGSKKKSGEEKEEDSASASGSSASHKKKASSTNAAAAVAGEVAETPRVTQTIGFPLSTSEEAQAAAVLTSPLLLSAVELEKLRAKSLESFLEVERARLNRGSPAVRQRIVYFGNGYSTPDTGIHIPTPTEVKIKEDRERMARYGQTVSKEVREAEEKRIRDMHPMGVLANRQVIASAASAYFSLLVTRERGVYAWSAQDAPEPVIDESTIDSKDKKKASTAGSSKNSGKTKVQEARKAILGLLNPLLAPKSAISADKAGDKKAVAAASTASDKDKGKASPRSTAKSPVVTSTKKLGGIAGATPGSRPGSSSGLAPAGELSLVPSLLPPIPTTQQPLGYLCSPTGGPSLPVYIPELQGVDVVSVAAGVHVAFLLTSLGSLFAWEHASRKIISVFHREYAGAREAKQHLLTTHAIRAQLSKDKEFEANGGVIDAPARPGSSSSPPATSRKMSGGESTRKDKDSSSKSSSSSGKVSSRKAAKKGASEAEVLVVDSAAYEAEQQRLERLSRDADLDRSGKQIANVIVGGSGTLSSTVFYPNAAADFEFVLVLTADGCVYSSLITPPAPTMGDAAAAPGAKGGASAAAGASSAAADKAKAKDREQSTAMLGVGEKGKEKDTHAKDKHAEVVVPPLVHFELVSSLHPANLTLAATIALKEKDPAAAVAVPASNNEIRIVQLQAGYGHVLALASDHSVYSWGIEGPWLGLGADKDSKKPRFLPTKIEPLSQICLPILNSGSNAGSAAASRPPSAPNTDVAAAPAGKAGVTPLKGKDGRPISSSASKTDGGQLSARSQAKAGKKGDKADSGSELPPDTVAGPNDPVVAISSGAFHSLALTASGAVFAWGRNTEGQLGLGDNKDRELPALVTSLSPSHNPSLLVAALEKANAPPVKASAQSSQHGYMSARGPASPVAASAPTPTSLSPFLRVSTIAAGGAHSVVFATPLPEATHTDVDGNVSELAVTAAWSCGSGSSGATGLSSTDDTTIAQPISFFNNQRLVSLLAAGDCSQGIVQREVSQVVSLEIDEDDVPNAVLIN